MKNVILAPLFVLLVLSFAVFSGIERGRERGAAAETALAQRALRAEIEALRSKMADLETRLRRMEARGER
jgi:hypothetical protein